MCVCVCVWGGGVDTAFGHHFDNFYFIEDLIRVVISLKGASV